MSIDTLRGMRHVLFVCNHNAGRSQMAQAFFERHAPEGFRAESAAPTPQSRSTQWSLRRCARSACADVILDEYDGAPVRSFVLQLAHRRTRDCLRAAVCEPLALV